MTKLNDALILIGKLFNKDTRFTKDFDGQYQLLSHVQNILEFANRKQVTSFKTQITEIQLLLTMGHMYTQMGNPQNSEQYLSNALQKFLRYFLKTKMNDFDMSCRDEHDSENIKNVHDALSSLSENQTNGCVIDLVHQKAYNKDDLKIWKEKGVDIPQVIEDSDVTQLSEEHYKLLQECNAALPLDIVEKIYLPELFISLLYTYGRVYFYKKNKGIPMTDVERGKYYDMLKFAYELCRFISSTHKVCVLHRLLTQRYGLLYFKLDDEDNMPNILYARDEYSQLYHDKTDYYEFGVLKKTETDKYNKVVCLKQMLKCHNILLTKGNETDRNENLDEAKRFSHMLEQQTEELEILNQSAFQNERAMLLMNIANLFKDDESLIRAKEILIGSCVAEKKSGLIKYPWYQALEGLVKLIGMGGGDRSEVIEKLREYKDAIQKASGDYSKDLENVAYLLEKVNHPVKESQNEENN